MTVDPHLKAAVEELRAADVTGHHVTLSNIDRGALFGYIVRLQDAVLAADTPWPFPAEGVFDDPRKLVAQAAAEIRDLEASWPSNAIR